MNLITANVITLVSMLASCFLAAFLPSVIHIHADANSRKKKILAALKRYSNCLSGGVFAGAFFTQFYPHVTKEFSELLQPGSVWKHPFQLGPTLVFAGFLLTALLERLVDMILKQVRRTKSARAIQPAGPGAQELRKNTSKGPLVLEDSSSNDEESSVDTDPLATPMLTLTLPNQTKTRSTGSRNNNSGGSLHGDSHDDHGGHSHHHHHHHHHDISLEDYQGKTRFIVFVASLGTHSIFEGLALGLIKDTSLLMNMFISVIVHEILMALALGISLSRQKMKMHSRVIFCFAFAVIIPLGQGIGLLVQQAPPSAAATAVVTVLQAAAAGTFLHVMFMEILPQEMHDNFGILEALWIVIGYVSIPLSSFITSGKDHH